jgi:hypothetical protein
MTGRDRGAASLEDRIQLESEIPADHPARRQVEEAIREELAPFPWKWHVRILCNAREGWWAVLVTSPHFETTTFLHGPADQQGGTIRARLRSRLQDLHSKAAATRR